MAEKDPQRQVGERRQKIVRKNYLSNSKVQLELIAYFLVALCLVIGILYFKVHEVVMDLQNLGGSSGRTDPSQVALFKATRSTLNWLFLYCTINSVVLIVVGGIFFTHRVTGPVTALRKYFNEILIFGRILRPLSFRKNDYFLELPQTINLALEKLAPEKIERVKPEDF